VALALRGADNFLDRSANAMTFSTVSTVSVVNTGRHYGNMSFSIQVGSGLKSSPSSQYVLGTDPFTLECWLNMNTVPPAKVSVGSANSGGGQMALIGWAASDGSLASWRTFFAITFSTGVSWDQVWLRSQQNPSGSSVNFILSTPLEINTWYHIALVRPVANSAVVNIYINGVFQGTLSIGTANFTFGGTSTVCTVGYTGLTTYEYSVRGYIDDVRITKGIARYDSNFTPPIAL
jgi:hypothetical protein